jgi:hypothetical protein
MGPRSFYETHVKENCEMWIADYTNEVKAMNAASAANNMAEYMYDYLKEHKPELLCDAAGPADYRKNLVIRECAHFQIIWDVADSHKHIRLRRRHRQVTCSDQTNSESLQWDSDKMVSWNEATFTWKESEEIFVVTLDSGEKRILRVALERVLEMWERLLSDMRL